MTRDEIVYKALLFGCEDLNMDPPTIDIIQGSIYGNPDIAAATSMKNYSIYFKEDWYETARIDQIMVTLFHELRHMYQYQLVLGDKNNNIPIKELEEAYKKYVNHHNIDLNKNEYNIEIDAIQYSKKTFYNFLIGNRKNKKNKNLTQMI